MAPRLRKTSGGRNAGAAFASGMPSQLISRRPLGSGPGALPLLVSPNNWRYCSISGAMSPAPATISFLCAGGGVITTAEFDAIASAQQINTDFIGPSPIVTGGSPAVRDRHCRNDDALPVPEGTGRASVGGYDDCNSRRIAGHCGRRAGFT